MLPFFFRMLIFCISACNSLPVDTENIYTQGNVEIDQGALTIDPIDDATGGFSMSKTISKFG